jgi:hypothetical protein
VARGEVFGVAGAFVVVAAASSGPDQAQRLDGSLRKIATTPLGPWLLVAVALGFVIFGVCPAAPCTTPDATGRPPGPKPRTP